jgi:hypothetical protein
MHRAISMKPRVPHSYDEILRHTVPDPVGSYSPEPPPSERELQLDRQIGSAISAALIEHGIEMLSFEVTSGRVILRGWVRDRTTASRIQRIVADAAPDALIDSRLRIGPGSA